MSVSTDEVPSVAAVPPVEPVQPMPPAVAPQLIEVHEEVTHLEPVVLPHTPALPRQRLEEVVELVKQQLPDNSADLLAQGIMAEEAQADPPAAIRSYQAVVAQFDSQREIAAQAVFRLAECYRKLGRLEEASVYYARILRDFPDQPELAERSRKILFSRNPQSRSSGYGSSGGATGGMGGYGNRYGASGYGGGGSNSSYGFRSTSQSSGVPAAPAFGGMNAGGGMATGSSGGFGGGGGMGGSVGGARDRIEQEEDIFAPSPTQRRVEVRRVYSTDQEMERQISQDMAKQRQALQEQMMKLEEAMAKMEREQHSQLMSDLVTPEPRDPRREELARQLKMAESEFQTAQREAYVLDRKLVEAEVNLDILQRAAPERLPRTVVNDARYQELKSEYETALMEAASSETATPEATANVASRVRILKTWVEQIYLPEQKEALQALQIQRARLGRDIDVSRMRVTELREIMEDIERNQAEERAKEREREAAERLSRPLPTVDPTSPFEAEPR